MHVTMHTLTRAAVYTVLYIMEIYFLPKMYMTIYSKRFLSFLHAVHDLYSVDEVSGRSIVSSCDRHVIIM